MATIITPERLSPTELVERHQVGIWRYLRFLGCDAGLADDLTQETFLAAFASTFEQRSRVETAAYLRRIARNQYVAHLRSLKSAPVVGELEVADEVWSCVASDAQWQEHIDALDECLKKLTQRTQYALQLRYRHNQSRCAMAVALKMTKDGVKTLLRRARESLRRCIERKIK